MKIFEFNPETGRRGALIDNVRIIQWTAESVDFMTDKGAIDPIEYRIANHPDDQSWTAHIDAGAGNMGEEVSYQHETEWRCFCMGNCHYGRAGAQWEWIILPPKNLIKRRAAA